MLDKETIKYISDECLKLLAYSNKNKKEITPEIIQLFLQTFISTMATSVLTSTDSSSMPMTEKHKIVSEMFRRLKTEVQEGVALGFGKSMSELTGKRVDYVCSISIMPEAKNKLPC